MSVLNVEQIKCRKCGELMPKLRLQKYGYSDCVGCSTESPKQAITVLQGEGDHTWNDIIILDSEAAKRLPVREYVDPLEENFAEYLDEDSKKAITPLNTREKVLQVEEDILDIPEEYLKAAEEEVEDTSDIDWELSENL